MRRHIFFDLGSNPGLDAINCRFATINSEAITFVILVLVAREKFLDENEF